LKIDEYTGLIIKESERVDAMAMDLLDYASRNDYYEKYERIGLCSFINNIVKDFENVSKQENVKLVVNIPENVFVDAYSVQLKKVFTNLIKNAIEAKQGNENDEVKIVAERLDGNIKITIKDKGTGVEKDKLAEIFEPLITTKIQGTGLGLTIVKDIIEKHNGRISVNSEKNIFTEFTIVLPETII
jgi:signal transduction histidine kinase